jgi:hypothetical protein
MARSCDRFQEAQRSGASTVPVPVTDTVTDTDTVHRHYSMLLVSW